MQKITFTTLLLLTLVSRLFASENLDALDGCDAPTNITLSSITDTSVVINWDLPIDVPFFYQYCVVTDGVAVDGPVTTDGTVTSASTDGAGGYVLTPDTMYYVFVRSVCMGDNGLIWGDWSPSVTFTTLPATPTCSSPTNITVSNISFTSVDISWDAPADAPFFYQYCVVTDGVAVDGPTTADGTITAVSTDVMPGGYTLEPDTMYYVFVRSVCMGDNGLIWGDWSPSVTFTTLFDATCNAPSAIVVSNVTDTSADFSWDMPTTGYPFMYQYCLVTDGVPVEGPSTAAGVTTASTTDVGSYGDLTPNTTYNLFVRTFCVNTETGETAWSEWSSMTIFTTTALGLSGYAFDELKVYPNPVTSVVNVTNGNPIESLEIYDMLGKRVFVENYNTTEVTIDARGFKKGFYIMCITSHNTRNTLKLVKN